MAERRDRYWKQCDGCQGTGRVQRNNNNGGETKTCGMCHGACGKWVDLWKTE